MRLRLSSMRTMICSRVAGASSDLLKATSLPTCFCRSSRHLCSESSAPAWNGSMIRNGEFCVSGQRTRKCPGKLIPSTCSPARRATSIYTTDSVIGIPVRRSSTSLRQLLRGSSYLSRLPTKCSVSKRYELSARMPADVDASPVATPSSTMARRAASPMESNLARYGSGSRRGYSMRAMMSVALRSEEHTSELQSQSNLVCRLLLEKKNQKEQEPDHGDLDATHALGENDDRTLDGTVHVRHVQRGAAARVPLELRRIAGVSHRAGPV